ncbi:type IV pilus assembly protein PilW [Pseudoalteromonas citrea]|uniref:Type IV pilus assembly protein PilW n=2 Tax=Pseudoalteromonas citrea TaxID=43655 RepID=A0AAD4FT70_9GAMM|nr:PilW family protein [Pseudoalteromonas citrea]KAF7774263.1 type IV pilus assembly protein PilW [Pseudoalteromonas citrea]
MKRTGFSILELMISMFIGALILGGVIATYVSMKVTTRDTMAIGEMQETGRLALSILQRDIEQVGFWGTFYDEEFTAANVVSPSNPSGDCFGGINNGSFPDSTPSNFRSIYAEVSDGSNVLGCVSNSVEDTDVLQLKLLEGNPIDVASTATDSNRYYFIAEQERASFVTGAGTIALPTVNATVWPYSHHVYFISTEELTINNVTRDIPILRRLRLSTSGMQVETVMEGIEDFRLVFGLDTDADGRVNTYRSTQDMTTSDWENDDGVLTVQIYLLVRALEPDPGLQLNSQTYTLGVDPDRRTHTFADNFRRTVFTTTIRLNGAMSWSM